MDRPAEGSKGDYDGNDPCQEILDETIAALYSGDTWYWTENIAFGELGAHFGHAHQFHFSAGARVMDVGDDFVLLVRSDEFDVQFVELYRLIKG